MLEYSSEAKKNGTMKSAGTWIELGNIILSDVT